MDDRTWWNAWWEADYSWDGLAAKRWTGWFLGLDGRCVDSNDRNAPSATLQDYWRSFENDLIESPVSGKRFTRLHLPLRWEDGSSTGKIEWAGDALNSALVERLARAAKSRFEGPYHGRVLSGADKRAQFQGIVFLDFHASVLRAQNETISATFKHAAFTRDAHFSGATFANDTRFNRAGFCGIARFQNVVFHGHTAFSRAVFGNVARFERARFDGPALFDATNFISDALFESAVFMQDARFPDATFCQEARFEYAGFGADVQISRAVFGGRARFDGVGERLSIAASDHLAPRAQRAFKRLWAERAVCLGSFLCNNRDILEQSTFADAQFFGRAEFHGSALHQGVTFHGASFEKALTPHQSHAAPKRALEELYMAVSCARDLQGELPLARSTWMAQFTSARAALVEKFSKLDVWQQSYHHSVVEGAFRTLKQAMEANRNRSEEARFFKLELKARRHRRDSAVPIWERLASDFYELTSDFGNSIFRPLLWIILGLIPTFAVMYAFAASLPAFFSEQEFLQALQFSMSRVLPFGPWDGVNSSALVSSLIGPSAPTEVALPVRILASLQSLVAIILVFLAGLAVRRRFQIS